MITVHTTAEYTCHIQYYRQTLHDILISLSVAMVSTSNQSYEFAKKNLLWLPVHSDSSQTAPEFTRQLSRAC